MLFTALLTLHLIGLSLGLGAATIADVIVLRYLRRQEAWPADLIRTLSQSIWVGLAILGVSGATLFALKPSSYLHNNGFLAKMVLVAVLTGNGVVLHRRLAALRMSRSSLLLGAVSAVSWYGALLIAMFKAKVHLSLADYLIGYALALVVVWLAYQEMYRRILSGRPSGASDDDSSLQALPSSTPEQAAARVQA